MFENFNSRANFLKSGMNKGVSSTFTGSGNAEFCYLGKTSRIVTPLFFCCEVLTPGVGAQVAECGFFSTPKPPQNLGVGQVLTKLVSTGSMDALTSTGIKRNSVAFNVPIPAWTHVWAGIRTAMATSQPAFTSIGSDFQQDFILIAIASGVLTGAGPFTGTTVAQNVSQIGDMRLELI